MQRGGLSQLVLLKTSADPQPEREFVYSKNTLEGKLHYELHTMVRYWFPYVYFRFTNFFFQYQAFGGPEVDTTQLIGGCTFKVEGLISIRHSLISIRHEPLQNHS